MSSVRIILRVARAALSAGSSTPALDAELLLAHALNRERSFLHAHPEAILPKSQEARYARMIKRRASGEPLAYIVGVKEFWSLPLRVTPDVLIPRPETELLVELALARIPKQGLFKIADLGTGSGAIALAIAHERPDCELTATDVSRAALEVASDNARRLGMTNIRFVASDWFRALRGRFNLIMSNPPYVALDDPHLQDTPLRFEPRQALISEAQGLRDIETIVRGAGSFLHSGGWLVVEHGFEQGAAVRELFERHGFARVEFSRDLAGHKRATFARAVAEDQIAC